MNKTTKYSIVIVLVFSFVVIVAGYGRTTKLVEERRLISGVTDANASDDCKHVIYRKGPQIWFLDLEHNKKPAFVDNEMGAILIAWPWLFNGERFAYGKAKKPGQNQVWTYNTNDGSKTLVADYTPAYISPEGKLIYSVIYGKSPLHTIRDVRTGKMVAKEPAKWIKVATGGQRIGKTGIKNPLIAAAQNWKPLNGSYGGLSPDGKYMVSTTKCSCGLDGKKGPGPGKCRGSGLPNGRGCLMYGMPTANDYVVLTRDGKPTLIGRGGAAVLWYSDSKKFLIQLTAAGKTSLFIMNTNLKRTKVQLPRDTKYVTPVRLLGRKENRLIYLKGTGTSNWQNQTLCVGRIE